MTLMDDPCVSADGTAASFTSSAARPSADRLGEPGVTLVLRDPGGSGPDALLERLPDQVDELILVRDAVAGTDPGALQRAGLTAARNACVVMADADRVVDSAAIARFIDALRSGCAGVAVTA